MKLYHAAMELYHAALELYHAHFVRHVVRHVMRLWNYIMRHVVRLWNYIMRYVVGALQLSSETDGHPRTFRRYNAVMAKAFLFL